MDGKRGFFGRLLHSDFVIYTVFGAMATLVNMGSYYLFYEKFGWANLVSTFVAWLLAVTFAFFTNKFFVFLSYDLAPRKVFSELVGFFSCRISTGVLDMAIMFVAVDLLSLHPNLWKFISNLIVGIVNYLVGKFMIFGKKKGAGKE